MLNQTSLTSLSSDSLPEGNPLPNPLPQVGEGANVKGAYSDPRDAGSLCETNLNHAWIARHIPHQGSMCLLDRVEVWDPQRIQCRAISHRAADNPLRANDRLGAACGIEYAAQAMAVHGALLAPPDSTRARVGYLVSVRGTKLHVLRLDDIAADLLVEASCITRSENNILYQFSVSAAGQLLLEGRAAIVVDAEALSSTSGNTP